MPTITSPLKQASQTQSKTTAAQLHIDRPWRWLIATLLIEIIIILSINLPHNSGRTTTTAEFTSSLVVDHTVEAIAWSGEYMALAGTASLRLYEGGHLVRVYDGYDQPTRNRHVALAFSPDGTQLATLASDSDSNEISYATLKMWEVESGKLMRDTVLHGGGLFNDYFAVAIAYSPDGNWLATSAGDGYVMITDAVSGEVLARLFNYSTGTHALTFSADGQRLVVISHTGGAWSASHQAGALEVWDIHDLNAPVIVSSVGLSPFSLDAASISPDGGLFVRAEDYWEARISVGWSSDGRILGSALIQATATAFSPAGDLLAYQEVITADGISHYWLHVARWQGEGETFQLVDAFPPREMDVPGIYHLHFRQTAQGLVLNYIPIDRLELVQWNLEKSEVSSIDL